MLLIPASTYLHQEGWVEATCHVEWPAGVVTNSVLSATAAKGYRHLSLLTEARQLAGLILQLVGAAWCGSITHKGPARKTRRGLKNMLTEEGRTVQKGSMSIGAFHGHYAPCTTFVLPFKTFTCIRCMHCIKTSVPLNLHLNLERF